MAKILYKVLINYSGEIHEYFGRAFSESHALELARRALAKKLGYTVYHVRNSKHSFGVQAIKK
jgi:hypothetical protein